MRRDVLVIGAGVLGLSSAVEAARLGAHVTVVERDYPASGSSGLSAGVVGAYFAAAPDIAIRAESLKYFEGLGEHIGFRRTGVLRLVTTGQELQHLQAAAELQREAGFDDVRVVSCAELQMIVPDMRVDDLAGALVFPQGGYVDGHLLCGALQQRAEALGSSIHVRTEVIGIDRDAGPRVRVHTNRGTLEADAVVNAAGAWAGGLGKMLGLATPILPQRHEVLIARLPEPMTYSMPHVGSYFYQDDGQVTGDGLYWRPESPTSMLVGEHAGLERAAPSDPDDYFQGVSAASIERVAERLLTRLPGLANMGLEGGWAGLYPMTPDEQPLVGPWRDDDRIIGACGAGGFGVQIAPAVGRVAGEWAATGEADLKDWGERLLPDRETLQSSLPTEKYTDLVRGR